VEFFSDGFEIETRCESRPCRLLDGAIDFAQALRRNAQCHDLSDSHHHAPGHDPDAGRWKRLLETLLSQLCVYLLERVRSTMLEENGEQNAPFDSETSPLIRNLQLSEWTFSLRPDPHR
jgi:hypothetical protein